MIDETDLFDDTILNVCERYLIGVGITPRMVTNIETGENYYDGQAAADALGVTRQNINNCIHGRQKTVAGCRLVRAADLRREFLPLFVKTCEEHGTEYWEVIEALREQAGKGGGRGYS